MAKKKASSRKPKRQKPPPTCKAILLCDQTIIEQETEKPSLIGIFTGFLIAGFPGVTRPFMVFLQLVNGIEEYELTVEIQDLRQDHVLARATFSRIIFQDRQHIVNAIIPVPALPLAHAGIYELVVLANGLEIERQRFRAIAIGGHTDAEDHTEEDG
jgi:hypothetical protein